MLTVKFVDRDGTESIQECFSVIADRTEHDGRPRVLVFDEAPQHDLTNHKGIYVDTISDEALEQLGEQSLVGPVLYIMNRFGSTVATYQLRRRKAPILGVAQAA